MKNIFKKIKLLHNLYIKNRCFIKRTSYSQDGEDLVIKNIFKNVQSGVYIDVGCYHPIEISNTALLYDKGWNGINIDISEYSIKLFNHLKPDDINLNLAVSNKNGMVEFYYQKKLSKISTINKAKSKKIFQNKIKVDKIESKTLTNILDGSIYKDKLIHLLNIDAEGHDFEVLQSLDFERYYPIMICVEIFPDDGNFDDFDIKKTPVFKMLIEKNYILHWSGYFSHIFLIENF